MNQNDLDQRLDQAIDALNKEASPTPYEQGDPELFSLVDTARLAKSLRDPAEPDADFAALAINRITADLRQTASGNGIPPAATPSLGTAPDTRGGNDEPRGPITFLRRYAELAAIIVVLLVVGGGVLIYQSLGPDNDGAPAIGGSQDAGYGLYLLHPERKLQPLNAATLENLDDAEMLELYPWSWFALSADGSTMATIEYSRRIIPTDPNLHPDEVEIVIADGLTGSERVRFQPPEHVHQPILSNDGSRLLVQSRVEPEFEIDPVWYIFDTSDGSLRGSIEGVGQYTIGPTYFSADATRLYSAVNGWTGPEIVADQFQIKVYNVASGAEIDGLTLADIPVGAWSNDSEPGSATVQDLQPAVALSPDASTIAVVHAHEDAMTLIDVETLTVRSTFTYAPGDASIDHWLERDVPEDAFVKSYGSYIYRGASFSPDGRYLYVHGQGNAMDANLQPLTHSLGLSVIDLNTGETVATAFADDQLMQVKPAPDGRSVYVIRDDREEVNDEPQQTLLRLDARTLDILAERTVDSTQIIIDARPGSGIEDASLPQSTMPPSPTAQAVPDSTPPSAATPTKVTGIDTNPPPDKSFPIAIDDAIIESFRTVQAEVDFDLAMPANLTGFELPDNWVQTSGPPNAPAVVAIFIDYTTEPPRILSLNQRPGGFGGEPDRSELEAEDVVIQGIETVLYSRTISRQGGEETDINQHEIYEARWEMNDITYDLAATNVDRDTFLEIAESITLLSELEDAGFSPLPPTAGIRHPVAIYLEPVDVADKQRIQIPTAELEDFGITVVTTVEEFMELADTLEPLSLWINGSALTQVPQDWLRDKRQRSVVIVGINATK